MYYYYTLLGLFAGTSLCAASQGIRGARVDLRTLKDRTGSSPSSQQLELKRDAAPQLVQTITGDPSTSIKIETDIVTAPGSSESRVVVTLTSATTVPHPSSTLPTTSEVSSTTRLTPASTSALSYTCNNGFYLCPSELNGGCCADGYTCAAYSCIPPPTATGGHVSCAAGSYLCPADMQYGCCPGGYDCGISQCFTIGQTPYTSTMMITSSIAGSPVISVATVTMVSSAYTKASAINLLAKQTFMADDPSSTLKPTPSSSPVSEISPVTIGGIIAGCLVGIAVFVFLGWYTFRRVGSRGNHDPPGDLGVATTNYYDPTVSGAGAPGITPSTRYHTGMQDGYFAKMPFKKPKKAPSQVLSSVNGLGDMTQNVASYPEQQSQVVWGSGNHNNTLAELSGDREEPVYEIDGTPVRGGGRWSRAFSRNRSGG